MNLLKKILAIFGGIFVVAALVLIVGNILLRTFFNTPIQGSYEMIALCSVLFVSTAIPMCTLSESHIEVSFLVRKFSKMSRMVLELIARIIDALFSIILVCGGYYMGSIMLRNGESTNTLSIPIYPFRMLWVLCAALIVVADIILIIRVPKKYRETPETAAEPGVPEGGGQS